jgi:hypothetical protein
VLFREFLAVRRVEGRHIVGLRSCGIVFEVKGDCYFFLYPNGSSSYRARLNQYW